MSIKKAINKETNEEYSVLISVTKFNAKQFDMIQRIIAFYDNIDANYSVLKSKFENAKQATEEDKARYAKRLYRRVEIYHASVCVDKDRHCAVYYVTKNKALQTANHLYDLKRCKLDSASAKNDAKQNDAHDAKRESKAKRENSAKREQISASASNEVKALEANNEAIALLESASESN